MPRAANLLRLLPAMLPLCLTYSPPPHNEYNTSGGPIEGKLNVHLVPHSHNDVGWQLTVDQYAARDVFYIIETVVDALAANQHRRFIYAEVAYFSRWWDRQSSGRRNLVKELVKERRLVFVNGGW